MIIEHRTYTLPHGGMDAYLARYRELALPLQMRHLGRLLGFFVSDIGTLNQVLHIWAYDSMADREAAARAGGRSGLAGIQARQSRDLRGAAGVDLARGVVQSETGQPGTVMSDSTLTNPLLRTLREGGLAASLIVRLFDGPEIGRIAATAGLDALYVDLEHSPVAAIRQPHLQRHPRGGRDAAGARARHRRRADRPRVDGGALGIIAPQVESAADAARVVACCRHPPRGRRSYAGGQAALGYRDLPQAEAMAALDASVLTAVMIESRNALDAVEAIASVDGLDLLFIGAHDLAADLAGQWDHRRCCERWPHPPGLPGCGQGAGPGGLAGQPALLRELAAPPLGCWSRRARTWPACSARPRSAPPPRCATGWRKP